MQSFNQRLPCHQDLFCITPFCVRMQHPQCPRSLNPNGFSIFPSVPAPRTPGRVASALLPSKVLLALSVLCSFCKAPGTCVLLPNPAWALDGATGYLRAGRPLASLSAPTQPNAVVLGIKPPSLGCCNFGGGYSVGNSRRRCPASCNARDGPTTGGT